MKQRLFALAGLLALAVGQSAMCATTIDTGQLLAALNEARTDPAAYGQDLRVYRGYFHANLLRYPASDVDIVTEEGVAVVDEASAFLRHQAPLGGVLPSALLQQSAADHVADQGRTGGIGHNGSDGSTPRLRVERRGGGSHVAEIISYGSVDAVDAMRQLIVDDGVADRGHRDIVYSSELHYAGAACGPHPVYRTVCVIDLGVTPDGTYPGESGARPLRTAAR